MNSFRKSRCHHLAVLLLLSVYVLMMAGCGATRLISMSSYGEARGNGNSFNASISADGRFVAFTADWLGIWVHDRTSHTTEELIETQNLWGYTGTPSISSDGRFVAFSLRSETLHPDARC